MLNQSVTSQTQPTQPDQSHLHRFSNPILKYFQRLQWKLTLAYTLSTAITILILVGMTVGFLWYTNFRSTRLPNRLADGLLKAGPKIAVYLETTTPNIRGLDEWLDSVMHDNNLVIPLPRENGVDETDTLPAQFGRAKLLAVTDAAGRVLVSHPVEAVTGGQALQPQLQPGSQALLQAALAGQTELPQLSSRNAAGDMVAAAPIFDDNDTLVGAIFLISAIPIGQSEFLQVLLQGTILPAALTMLIVGIIAGIVFGYIISRGLIHRLKLLTQTTDEWSHGDFSRLALDSSADELGQLARHMNHMAIQLQNLLQTRQELATLEERNRLARDLHDSVKQQVFATAMQVGAAKALIEQQPVNAKDHLQEAEQLIKQAQQELTTLIKELRPVALEGKGLAVALQQYAANWSRQTNIESEVRIRGERSLPLSVEQTLYRLAQEGLANVARHSQATHAEIDLAWEANGLTLIISDNGQGFNPNGVDNGVGLKSMQERIEAVGGGLLVQSEPGQGTQVTARLANIG